MGLIEKLYLTKRRSRRMVRSMLISGVFPYRLRSFDIRKYLWPSLCIFGLSYIVVFTTYNLRSTKSFLQQIATAKTVLSSLMCLLVLLITMWKSRELMFFVDLTENDFFRYSDQHRFRYKFSVSQSSENTLIYTSSLYFVFIYSSAILSQPIYLIFNPELLHSGTRQLIFTWVPWKDDTIFAFVMGHTTLIVITIPVVMNIVGNVSVILNAYLELRNQFERMAYAMNTIVARTKFAVWQRDERPRVKIENVFDELNDECALFSQTENEQFEKYLIECIQHYQLVRKCFLEFSKWFEFAYSVILGHSVLTLAMMSYGALLSIKSFGVLVKYLSILLMYTGQVYMYCYTGEKIVDLNQNFGNVLYNLPWYRIHPKRRKLFYIFQVQVQRPFRLHGINIYDASFNIFSSIMKLSYSYLNLLRTYGSSTKV